LGLPYCLVLYIVPLEPALYDSIKHDIIIIIYFTGKFTCYRVKTVYSSKKLLL